MRLGVWFVAGVVALALGAFGILLPLVPTTPFIILAAFAFGKSSPRLQVWLERNPTFGQMITDWRANGVIATRYKAIAMVMMAGGFAASAAMGVAPLVLLVQGVCMSGAAAYVLSRPGRPN